MNAPSRRLRLRRSRPGAGRVDLVAYPLVAPAMVITGLFFFAPMAFSLFWSFTHYNGLLPPEWVGAANYVDLAKDPSFRGAVENTLVFAFATMVVGPALGLGSALLLN